MVLVVTAATTAQDITTIKNKIISYISVRSVPAARRNASFVALRPFDYCLAIYGFGIDCLTVGICQVVPHAVDVNMVLTKEYSLVKL